MRRYGWLLIPLFLLGAGWPKRQANMSHSTTLIGDWEAMGAAPPLAPADHCRTYFNGTNWLLSCDGGAYATIATGVGAPASTGASNLLIGDGAGGWAETSNTTATAAGLLTTAGEIRAGTNVRPGSTGLVYWNSRTQMSAGADGDLLVMNNAATDFGTLTLGALGGSGVSILNGASQGEQTAATAVDQITFSSDMTHDGLAADAWTGSVVRIVKANDVSGATPAVDTSSVLEIANGLTAQTGVTSETAEISFTFETDAPVTVEAARIEAYKVSDYEGAGTEQDSGLKLYGVNNGAAVLGITLANNGNVNMGSNLTVPGATQLNGDLDWNSSAVGEIATFDTTYTSTAANAVDQTKMTSTLTHDGGAADAWTGAILHLQMSNDAIETGAPNVDAVDSMIGLKITMDDDAQDSATGGNALFIDDNRSGAESDTTAEAALVIDAEGGFGLWVADGNVNIAGSLTTVGQGEFLGVFLHGVDAGVTAINPGVQGDYPIVETVTEVDVVGAASDAITMPPAQVGRIIYIINNDAADALEVWPASGDNFSGVAVDTAITLAAGVNAHYVAYDGTTWEAF